MTDHTDTQMDTTRDTNMDTHIKHSRLRVSRSRGALGGGLLIVFGAWAALIPFIGPYFNFATAPRPNDAFHWTEARGWLEVLPGAVAIIGGILLLVSANRLVTSFGGWIAAAGGAWLVIGPTLSGPLSLNLAGPDPTAGQNKQAAIALLFFYGIGAAIVLVAGLALGRLSVHSVRDVRAAERRAAQEAEREEAERRAAKRAAQERAAQEETERRAAEERAAQERAARDETERRAAEERATQERAAADDRTVAQQSAPGQAAVGEPIQPTHGEQTTPAYSDPATAPAPYDAQAAPGEQYPGQHAPVHADPEAPQGQPFAAPDGNNYPAPDGNNYPAPEGESPVPPPPVQPPPAQP